MGLLGWGAVLILAFGGYSEVDGVKFLKEGTVDLTRPEGAKGL